MFSYIQLGFNGAWKLFTKHQKIAKKLRNINSNNMQKQLTTSK